MEDWEEERAGRVCLRVKLSWDVLERREMIVQFDEYVARLKSLHCKYFQKIKMTPQTQAYLTAMDLLHVATTSPPFFHRQDIYQMARHPLATHCNPRPLVDGRLSKSSEAARSSSRTVVIVEDTKLVAPPRPRVSSDSL
ncbi:hypothetical protein V8G54_024823 [Vigna mungo]|uniref:Uncharacterized protein n=1 Tax=Vigna mungo TaxID=3915 RepID=A0AAQ3N6Z0_VIGMU